MKAALRCKAFGQIEKHFLTDVFPVSLWTSEDDRRLQRGHQCTMVYKSCILVQYSLHGEVGKRQFFFAAFSFRFLSIYHWQLFAILPVLRGFAADRVQNWNLISTDQDHTVCWLLQKIKMFSAVYKCTSPSIRAHCQVFHHFSPLE